MELALVNTYVITNNFSITRGFDTCGISAMELLGYTEPPYLRPESQTPSYLKRLVALNGLRLQQRISISGFVSMGLLTIEE